MSSCVHNQYHVCWCSGDARNAGISSHDIDLVVPEYPSFNTRRFNTLTTGYAWVYLQHCCYWCPGAKAPGHQYQHCGLNILHMILDHFQTEILQLQGSISEKKKNKYNYRAVQGLICNHVYAMTALSFFCFRSLAVGTRTGYKLFSLNSADKLENIYENGEYVSSRYTVSSLCWVLRYWKGVLVLLEFCLVGALINSLTPGGLEWNLG